MLCIFTLSPHRKNMTIVYVGQGLAGSCQELVKWGSWRARSVGKRYIIVKIALLLLLLVLVV